MAYGVNAPFGLRPFSSLLGGSWTEKTNEYYIQASTDGATTYATSIFTGDVVYWNAAAPNNGGGTVAIAGAVGTGPIGVFQGCIYTDINQRLIQSPFWPASTIIYPGSLIKCYVIDDPFVIYDVQVSTSTNVLANAVFLQSQFGQNAALAIAGGGVNLVPNNPVSGSIITGQSGYYLDGSTILDTATLTVKIIGYTPNPNNVPDANPNTVPFLNARVLLNVNTYKSVGTLGTIAV